MCRTVVRTLNPPCSRGMWLGSSPFPILQVGIRWQFLTWFPRLVCWSVGRAREHFVLQTSKERVDLTFPTFKRVCSALHPFEQYLGRIAHLSADGQLSLGSCGLGVHHTSILVPISARSLAVLIDPSQLLKACFRVAALPLLSHGALMLQHPSR